MITEDRDISKYPIGVFIGRLQVHELHEGHHYVINQVVKNHKKTIIFLGVPKFIGTKKNPLDFDTRKKMVQQHYPDSIIVALPDNRDDKKWVQEIDKRIREVYQHGDVLLYGGRDSFIPYYLNNGGKFATKELKQLGKFTGTDIRKTISEEVKNSIDFRSGVIYHTYNLYPKTIPTVDLAPIKNNNEVLIMKKYDEDQYRFIGGFILPTDKDISTSINRILLKKVGKNSKIKNITFVDSIQIDDWRFRGEDDKIMTSFFIVDFKSTNIEPGENISEIKWIKIDELEKENIVIEHKVLCDKLLNYLKK